MPFIPHHILRRLFCNRASFGSNSSYCAGSRFSYLRNQRLPRNGCWKSFNKLVGSYSSTATGFTTTTGTTSYVVQLANGTLMLRLYTTSNGKVAVVFSSDGGTTWGFQRTVVQVAVTGNVDLWNESNYVQLPNGTIFGIVRNDNATTASRKGWWSVTSTDNGATWSSPVQILTAMINPSRPALSITPSGNLFVMGTRHYIRYERQPNFLLVFT